MSRERESLRLTKEEWKSLEILEKIRDDLELVLVDFDRRAISLEIVERIPNPYSCMPNKKILLSLAEKKLITDIIADKIYRVREEIKGYIDG